MGTGNILEDSSPANDSMFDMMDGSESSEEESEEESDVEAGDKIKEVDDDEALEVKGSLKRKKESKNDEVKKAKVDNDTTVDTSSGDLDSTDNFAEEEDSDDDSDDEDEEEISIDAGDITNNAEESSDDDDSDEEEEVKPEPKKEEPTKVATPKVEAKTPKQKPPKTPEAVKTSEIKTSEIESTPKSKKLKTEGVGAKTPKQDELIVKTPKEKKADESIIKTPKEKKADKEVKTPEEKTSKQEGAVKEPKTPNQDGKTNVENTPGKTPKRTLKGGITVEELKEGNGPQCKPGNMVGMYYAGRLKKGGKQSDATLSGKPFKFKLGAGQVIKGWDIGVMGMKVGGKRRLAIPAAMGYGSSGALPDIPPNADLTFDIECKFVK